MEVDILSCTVPEADGRANVENDIFPEFDTIEEVDGDALVRGDDDAL